MTVNRTGSGRWHAAIILYITHIQYIFNSIAMKTFLHFMDIHTYKIHNFFIYNYIIAYLNYLIMCILRE